MFIVRLQCVFAERLKLVVSVILWRFAGKLFQVRGTTEENAHSPSLLQNTNPTIELNVFWFLPRDAYRPSTMHMLSRATESYLGPRDS